jgi:hypothetical protein
MNTRKNDSSSEHRSESVREARNEDPISGEPGSHPVGTGLGAAAGGAAAGAAAGSVAGPVGTILGTIAGGVAGAFAGKAVAESIDPTEEAAYWETEYRNRPYVKEDRDYTSYAPAYRAGWESYRDDTPWETVEPTVRQRWEQENAGDRVNTANMTWEEARLAAQDAYQRVHTKHCSTHSGQSPQKPR